MLWEDNEQSTCAKYGIRKPWLISVDLIGTHPEKAIKATRTPIRTGGRLKRIQAY
jgi:hypothetical protein